MSELQFGDYVTIEMFRYGAPNEMYLHKVVGTLKAGASVPVPVKNGAPMESAGGIVDVVNVICCGIDETRVYRVRAEDCRKVHLPYSLAYRLDQVELAEAKARKENERLRAALIETKGDILSISSVINTALGYGETVDLSNLDEKLHEIFMRLSGEST